MTDRPIIFSGPMVRALLAGRKTQTRRLASSPLSRCAVGDRLWVKENFIPDPSADDEAWDDWRMSYVEWSGCGCYLRDVPVALRTSSDCYFAATARDASSIRWRPSIHMPRWASRLTLIVTEVRQQPLQDMEGQHPLESDAIAEGVFRIHHGDGDYFYHALRSEPHPQNWGDPTDAFRELWDSLHATPGERWSDNPDVVALTFTVTAENIDRMAAPSAADPQEAARG